MLTGVCRARTANGPEVAGQRRARHRQQHRPWPADEGYPVEAPEGRPPAPAQEGETDESRERERKGAPPPPRDPGVQPPQPEALDVLRRVPRLAGVVEDPAPASNAVPCGSEARRGAPPGPAPIPRPRGPPSLPRPGPPCARGPASTGSTPFPAPRPLPPARTYHPRLGPWVLSPWPLPRRGASRRLPPSRAASRVVLETSGSGLRVDSHPFDEAAKGGGRGTPFVLGH